MDHGLNDEGSSQDKGRCRGNLLWFIFCLCALYVVIAAAVLLGSRSTGGRLVYTLDDAYIHLSIARNLVQTGVWGLNQGEFSGASSSPLWTLLLAGGFRVFEIVEWLPLAVNLLSAGLAFLCCQRLLRRFMEDVQASVIALLISAVTLPMLVAGGMEHSLQVALTFWTLSEFAGLLIAERSSNQLAPIVAAACAAALLVATRFEGIFLVFVACVVLLLKRKTAAAIIVGIAAWLPVILYAAYSLRHGGQMLPNSVLLKGKIPPHTPMQLLAYILHGVRVLLLTAPLSTVVVANGIALLVLKKNTADPARAARSLQIIFLGAAFIHCQVAQVGWFSRYEAYLIALGVATGCIAVAAARTTKDEPHAIGWRAARCALLVLLWIGPIFRGSVTFWRTTIAPGNIYRQQFQSAALVRRIGQPVAVNDIGVVSWSGGVYVVDLWGLANRDVFLARRRGEYGPAEMGRICQQHGVKLAIVFDDWFAPFGGLPVSWQKAASWTIPHNVASGDATVSIYATDPADAAAVKREVEAFSRDELPKDVRASRGTGF